MMDCIHLELPQLRESAQMQRETDKKVQRFSSWLGRRVYVGIANLPCGARGMQSRIPRKAAKIAFLTILLGIENSKIDMKIH